VKIAVLLGGTSPEREVSFASGIGIINALKELGHTVIPLDPALGVHQPSNIDEFVKQATHGVPPDADEFLRFSNRNVMDCINSKYLDGCNLVFNILHGVPGEDGTIQALLEMRGVPYTGSDVLASALAMDKQFSKITFKHIGVATPEWFCVPRRNDNQKVYEQSKKLGYPLVVKPNKGGSTIGITIVQNENLTEFKKAMEIATPYSELIMIEKYIPGKEVTVAVVGNRAFPVIEIKPKDGFYDYRHKYTKGLTDYFCPAELSQKVSERLKADALNVFEYFGSRGFARIDFRLSDDDIPYCLELNSIPGMTETSLVPKAAAASGVSYTQLCQMIVDDALIR
jgi:D-alanine-D-alanine ligase